MQQITLTRAQEGPGLSEAPKPCKREPDTTPRSKAVFGTIPIASLQEFNLALMSFKVCLSPFLAIRRSTQKPPPRWKASRPSQELTKSVNCVCEKPLLWPGRLQPSTHKTHSKRACHNIPDSLVLGSFPQVRPVPSTLRASPGRPPKAPSSRPTKPPPASGAHVQRESFEAPIRPPTSRW